MPRRTSLLVTAALTLVLGWAAVAHSAGNNVVAGHIVDARVAATPTPVAAVPEISALCFLSGRSINLYTAIVPTSVDYRGSSENEIIIGQVAGLTLSGGGGDDCVVASGGGNTLSGDGGADILVGGDGDDALAGGTENDQLFGLLGDDVLNGGLGIDSCDGGIGGDNYEDCEVTLN